MTGTEVIALIIVAVIGLMIKAVESRGVMTRRRLGVTMAIIVMVTHFGLNPLAMHFAEGAKLKREQWMNAVELDAQRSKPIRCYEGHSGSSASAGKSNCHRTYVSGTYTWEEPYDCGTREEPKTCYTSHRENIYTPYASVEYTYTITYFVPGIKEDDDQKKKRRTVTVTHSDGNVGFLEENPRRFKPNFSIPSNLPRGAPADWVDSRQRLDQGDPKAITFLAPYENHVVASDNELLQEYDGDVAGFRQRNLLPEHTRRITSKEPAYRYGLAADKMLFVGSTGPYAPVDDAQFQASLMRFNARCGMTKQCDMHVAVVDDNLVGYNDRVRYTTAFKAYAMSPAMGKRQLAKNTIVVVLGVRGRTIKWAEATTGMPYGNDPMLTSIRLRLTGKDIELSPETLFGTSITRISVDRKTWKETVTVIPGATPGLLEKIVFTDFPFKRACMKCEDKEEAGETGFVFLDITPSLTARVCFAIAVIVFSIIMLWLAMASAPTVPSRPIGRTTSRSYS